MMGLIFEAVPGELPLVQRVWSARCDAATRFTSAVKRSTLISFARYRHEVTVHLHGPETRATQLACPEGWEFFGVDLQPGAYLPLFPPSGLVNLNDASLPTPSVDRILLDNREWEMPTEQNVDVFVDRLLRAGLLVFDPLVEEIRHGVRPRAMSERTAQIRFRQAVGISHRKLISIEQARHAALLLVAGGSIADAIGIGGYYDQPQLTRAMRWATGHTPGELRSLTSFLAF
ncbi:AraC family transcriptional regulator [Micromonospora sp. WMMD1102]|uniref:helix-turn-helix domain-containing protein n=1 Tax=Micromonospora sp. WMMD1102 TaxID=3016105 RepID=UPI0024153B1A|nr:AraC family transcriptional regulator [Micromonospora sp. WMMD1102]MDG4791759.1 AraC family transcriptional regulator [Micromonospora sp. WMMD1102]